MINYWHKINNTTKYVLWPYLLLVLLHLFGLWQMRAPWNTPDEFIYLGHARFFAGGTHYLLQGIPYSNFGYSLFITPAFWLASNPESIYRLIVLFNAFLLSTLYVVLFYILKKIFNKDDKTAFLLAMLASFVPGIFTRSSLAMVENVFIPLFYLLILLFFLLLEKTSYTRVIIFALANVLLLAVHYRGLPVFCISFLFLLFLFFRQRQKKEIFSGLSFAVLGYIAVSLTNQYLVNLAWTNPIAYSIADLIMKVFSWHNIFLLFSATAGQILYLVFATFVLFFYALFYLIQKAKSFDGKKYFIFYVATIFLAIFASSVFVVMSKDASLLRPDHFIYGRYNEVLLPLILILGFEGLRNKVKVSSKKIISIIFILFLVLIAGAGTLLLANNYSILSTVSLSLLVFGPIWGTIFILLFTIIFYNILTRLRYSSAIFLMFFLFIINIIYYYNLEILPNNRLASFQQKIMPVLQASNIGDLDFDLNYFFHYKEDPNSLSWYWGRSYFLSQFYLPETRVHIFDSAKSEQAQNQAVISSCFWANEGYFLKEKIIIAEERSTSDSSNCLALWFKKHD